MLTNERKVALRAIALRVEARELPVRELFNLILDAREAVFVWRWLGRSSELIQRRKAEQKRIALLVRRCIDTGQDQDEVAALQGDAREFAIHLLQHIEQHEAAEPPRVLNVNLTALEWESEDTGDD